MSLNNALTDLQPVVQEMLQRKEVENLSYRLLLIEESLLTVKTVLSTHITNTDQNVAALQKSDEVPSPSLVVEQLHAQLASGALACSKSLHRPNYRRVLLSFCSKAACAACRACSLKA